MKCLKKNIIAALIFFQLFAIVNFSLAVSGSFNVDLNVDVESASVCDNDGVCDSGETSVNCSADCGCNNDGLCQSARGETASNCSADCVSFGGGGAWRDEEPPSIYGVMVANITLSSAVVSWQTTEAARCRFLAGKTTDYELAGISEAELNKEHSVVVSGLSDSTSYNFKIVCSDYYNNQSETLNWIFTTLSPPDIIPPANIIDFEGVGSDGKIELSWQNPPDSDFEKVLIVRSAEFYAASPWQGVPVYMGSQEGAIDINVENETYYYYTAFAYDKTGNYSSGAIATARPRALRPSEPPTEPPIPPIEPPVEPSPPEVEKIKLEDFSFFQEGGEPLVPEQGRIELKEKKPLTVLIDYQKVPEVLKTIMVSLEKDNKFFSFLLRINEEKTEYSAVLMPPSPGVYPISIYVLDYKNQALKVLKGELEIKGEKAVSPPVISGEMQFLLQMRMWLLYLLFSAVVLLIVIYFVRRKIKKRRLQTSHFYQ